MSQRIPEEIWIQVLASSWGLGTTGATVRCGKWWSSASFCGISALPAKVELCPQSSALVNLPNLLAHL